VKHLFGGRDRVTLERVVELAHRHLGLDLVFVTELVGGRRVLRAVAGDVASFGLELGEGPPAEHTYSQFLMTHQAPEVIPDTSLDDRVASLPATEERRVGAFIGVPLQYSDGTPYGVLGGMSHEPDPTLSPRDVRFMSMLAELVTFELDEQRRRDQLRLDLSTLIEGKTVEIAFQPIVGLLRGEVLGLEALARFPTPFGPPAETFSDAETVGLGLELESLAVEKAWKALEEIRPEQFVAFNVSPHALLTLARRAEARDSLPLEQVVVEVTEQAVVDSYGDLRDALAPLRAHGLRLAVDDAGAGYASLHHIVELRPDFIKVDRSLVDGLADDHARRVAVSAFALLALDLDAIVVAEGVERPEDLEALRDIGVQAGQGYLLGRPSTAAVDLSRWSDRQRKRLPTAVI